jgi:4-hydroxythreonine-4-phosphate dehydrogenase
MGDSRGIGPEVTIRTLQDRSIRRLADFLVIGDLASMQKAKKISKASMHLHEINLWEMIDSKKLIFDSNAINILNLGIEDQDRDQLRYIDTAVMLIKKGMASALVTAPVNKESIIKSGVKFQGHTEYLAGLTKTKKVAMMFAGGKLRVAVVTRHIPLKNVSKALTKEKIKDTVILTHRFLKDRLNIQKPKIGVCALNPHAGEGGKIGREEGSIIRPAIKSLKRRFPRLSGPIPADSAFNLLYAGGMDSLVAMYHDQAMIPVKTFARERCVNVTLGLPFVRTSPVHGTAYDIAGKGIADPSSMKEATRLACRLISV